MPTDRNKVRQWSRQKAGLKDKVPPMGAIIRKQRKEKALARPPRKWTMAEKIACIDAYDELKDYAQVAVKMDRSEDSIRQFLMAYQSTTRGARLTLEAGAEKLAKRIIKDANVEESMEVLNRLDVLPDVDRSKVAPQTSFQIIVGMPSTNPSVKLENSVPVPTQKQIEAAVDAEVVKDGTSTA